MSNSKKLSNDKQKHKSHKKYNSCFNNNNNNLIFYFKKYICIVIFVLFFKGVNIQFSH